MNIKLDVDPGP